MLKGARWRARGFSNEAIAGKEAIAFLFFKFMKKIECIVRPSDLDPLVAALAQTGIGGVTAYPVQGFGKQRAKGKGVLMPKMKLEIFALDIEVDLVLKMISKVTCQGGFGDGKIVILPVDDVVRIRTGEQGPKAVF